MRDGYLRDADGRILGLSGCAYRDCEKPLQPGHVFCAEHAPQAEAHWEADRQGWGIQV